MIGLGEFRFSTYTGGFHESQQESSWRWASQDVIGANPRLQYIGPGGETLTIQGTILPAYRGGLGQVEAMRTQAGLGKPLGLVTGWGQTLGQWCIERIGEARSHFMPDGAPRKIDFVISLRRYA